MCEEYDCGITGIGIGNGANGSKDRVDEDDEDDDLLLLVDGAINEASNVGVFASNDGARVPHEKRERERERERDMDASATNSLSRRPT